MTLFNFWHAYIPCFFAEKSALHWLTKGKVEIWDLARYVIIIS